MQLFKPTLKKPLKQREATKPIKQIGWTVRGLECLLLQVKIAAA